MAIANKVQTLEGSWLAIDGRILFQAKVDASEVHTTSLQARLVGLGLGFVESGRDGRDGRRPVFEVAGVDVRLLARWSSRRASIERQVADLVGAFEADHERPPTPAERLALGEQATLATRPAKHEPRSEAEQRLAWRAAADALLGRGGVRSMLRAVDSPPLPTVAVVDEVWLDRTAADVIARVEAGQASWLEWHVRSEALRRVRTAGVPLGHIDTTVDGIVERALSAAHSVPIATTRVLPVEPAALRPADGSSMCHVAGTARFTSVRILDAERRLVEAAGRSDGRIADGNSVAVALLQSLANGDRLNAGQRLLVQEMATSGRRLQLAIAPAGTGKTKAMRSLAAAWTDAGGDVLGLAPSAAAADQLGRQLAPSASGDVSGADNSRQVRVGDRAR